MSNLQPLSNVIESSRFWTILPFYDQPQVRQRSTYHFQFLNEWDSDLP